MAAESSKQHHGADVLTAMIRAVHQHYTGMDGQMKGMLAFVEGLQVGCRTECRQMTRVP